MASNGAAKRKRTSAEAAPAEGTFSINGRQIGPGHPVYCIAELSCNHHGKLEEALRCVDAMKEAGADAVKLQTYTPDTITLDCDKEPFQINSGTQWDGVTLHQLYAKAYTPWEWHKQIFARAKELGMDCFSSPFDDTAVDFLETLDVPAYKIASFEVNDVTLLKKVAATGKPVIMSSGQSTLADLDLGVRTLREAGCREICVLKCTSAYPATPEQCNLAAIPFLATAFNCVSGLSDHTLGTTVPIVAATLGACLIEKHFIMKRSDGGPDSAFSLEPQEFKEMTEAVKVAHAAIGTVKFGQIKMTSRFRRSLFVVKDMKKGERFTPDNVRSIRPADGLHTQHYDDVIGLCASRDIERGTALAWNLVDGGAA